MPTIDEVRKQGLANMPTYDYGNVFTKRDQVELDLDMDRAEFLNNLLFMEFQNEYNSPAAQVQRMRAAGLNPDLLGASQGGVSAGMSAPTGSAPEGVSSLDVAQTAFGIISNVLQLTQSMVSGVVGISSQLQNIDMNDFELGAKRLDHALNLAGMLDHTVTQTPDGNFVMVEKPREPISHFQSKRNNRVVDDLFTRYFYSNKARLTYFKDANEIARLRMDLGQIMSHPNYSNYDDEIYEAFEPLSDYAYRALISETEYKAKYYERANELGLSDLSAGADFASRKLAKDNDDFTRSLKDPLLKVAKNLKNKSKEGHKWADMALIALYTAMSATISRSSGQSVNGSTGEVFKNSSWDFGL